MVIKVFTQRNVCAGFGLASSRACSFALKIEQESFQVELPYNISTVSSLEIVALLSFAFGSFKSAQKKNACCEE